MCCKRNLIFRGMPNRSPSHTRTMQRRVRMVSECPFKQGLPSRCRHGAGRAEPATSPREEYAVKQAVKYAMKHAAKHPIATTTVLLCALAGATTAHASDA